MTSNLLRRIPPDAGRRRVVVGLLASVTTAAATTAATAATAALRAQPAAAPPLRVVASFSILADMLREVGGAAIEVSALVGPDADAHVYEPSPADVQRLARAELVVVNGFGFEGWIDRLIAASGYRGPVQVATHGIVPLTRGAGPDPHAWQSLALAQRYVDNLHAALVAARPAAAARLDARSADYRSRLGALHRSTLQRFAALPAADRRVVTSHDAFEYFGAAYGIELIAPQGWTTASEASAADVARIVRLLKAQRARALFVENISDPRLVERIAAEAGARLGGTLYSDALTPRGTPGDTYLRFFEHNVRTLLAALQPR